MEMHGKRTTSRDDIEVSESLEERVVAAIGHQYELGDEIGRGGMSVVYRARDIRLNRMVAVKVLPPELAFDQAVRVRFTREAQTSAQLSHPNIVPIYDVGERGAIAYFVMALITGENLGALLGQEPRLPIDDVRRIVREAADALNYAHHRGVIHRDIKPDNILLEADTGRVMVTDFGIARAVEAGSRLTATGAAIGTPTYMSPEQAVGEREVDGRSDIYSLGVVAYQMLTGRVPFTGGNSMALLLKHVTERPRPIEELRPETPKAMREAIERALMKDREDRWPTAAALRDALAGDDAPLIAWRPEHREPVRYTSPRPDNWRRSAKGVETPPPAAKKSTAQADERPVAIASQSPGMPLVLEPEHLRSLTPEQREDIRLWHGRITLIDRIKGMRGYAALTVAATVGGFAALAGVEDVPPLILAPIVPIYMWVKTWRRGSSLKKSGLKLRRVLLMPRWKWVLPAPPPLPASRFEKMAPQELLDGRHGNAIRRAAQDGAAILDIVGHLSRSDRAHLKDLEPTVKALVERVVHLAKTHVELGQSIDPGVMHDLAARIARAEKEPQSSDAQRQLGLLRRQHATLSSLVDRQTSLERQLESVGLALGNLRLDLIKLRSSGLQSALTDVSTATQEARALSREIDHVLEAAAEVRQL